MDWYRTSRLEKIPNILYHATFRNNLRSIRKLGLLPNFDKNIKCFPDCQNGVYLHEDPDVAFSYPEVTGNPMIAEEWLDDIIVLEIQTGNLDKDLFSQDPNLPPELSYASYLYFGTIPFSNILRVI